jgi:uridine kinase
MDDFFLRPEQRTAERYAQPGGNVDYERFQEEVLLPLKTGKAFSYRPFSCKTFTLSEPVAVTPRQLNIVEGTYCLHPYFGDAYDWKLFLSVDADLQRERVYQRPQHLQVRFFSDWIPMEKLYFDFYGIPAQADIRLDMTYGKF